VTIREKELLINRYETSINEIKKYIESKENEIYELSDEKFTTGVATGKLEELQEQLTAAEAAKVKQKEEKNYLDTARYLMQDTGIKTKIIEKTGYDEVMTVDDSSLAGSSSDYNTIKDNIQYKSSNR